MYLKKCQIRNFRSIKSLNISMENKIQTLVGLNEAGKSNILRALSLLSSEVTSNIDDVRDISHEESPSSENFVRFIFGLEEKDSNEIYKLLLTHFRMQNQQLPMFVDGDIKYTLKQFLDQRKNEALYTIELDDHSKSFNHWALSESVKIEKHWKKIPSGWPGLSLLANKSIRYISIKEFPKYEFDTTLKEVTAKEINILMGEVIVQYMKSIPLMPCIVWKFSENNLLPQKINLDSFVQDTSISEPLRNIFYLAGYQNIEKAITDAKSKTNGLKNLFKRVTENVTSHLNKVWPEYKNLSIQLSLNGDYIEAGIQDDFNFYSFERRSDGFKRFITFLLMISANVKSDNLKNTLIIIDEPDIGLHPSGIQYLREELKKISKNNIVFISTHSIFMVDRERIDTHLIVKKEKEETKVISNYSSDMLDEEVIYGAMGYSFYELLKKKNLVFEGWSDKKTFQLWVASTHVTAKDKAKWKNIGLIHAFGVKDVQRVATHLENFDREFLILTDADKPSIEAKTKYKGTSTWLTYKDLGFTDKETIEDFLSEDFVNNNIKSTLVKERLDAGLTIPTKTTFNKKLDYIKTEKALTRDDFERVKKLVKNSIFETLRSDRIDLKTLFNEINKKL